MKLYVLIREDLTPAQQAVQAGHALAQFMLDHADQGATWRNRTLIYLGIPSERHLKRYAEQLRLMERPVSSFREPDLGNELTAIATTHRLPRFDRLGLCRFISPRSSTMTPFRRNEPLAMVT